MNVVSMSVDYMDIYEALLRRSLERGVPSGVVAEVFELPADVVKEMAKEVKVTRFNTTDKAEYVEHIEWETLERVEQMILSGTPDQAARIATTVFGKQIAAAGKRPSSALVESQSDIMEAFAEMRGSAGLSARPGKFVVGNVAVDRRAHRIDDDEDE